MSDAKHTMGPWVAVKGFDDEPDRWFVVADAPKAWLIAMVHNGAPGDTLETEEANARVMAAAPDMLAALGAIIAEDDRLLSSGDCFSKMSGLIDKARAALARAGQAVPS